jgi:hypothetical protein
MDHDKTRAFNIRAASSSFALSFPNFVDKPSRLITRDAILDARKDVGHALVSKPSAYSMRDTIEFAMLYAAGGLWTILVAPVFWRVRPFKRLEQEVAAVWERTAALIGAIRVPDADTTSVVGRRRRERGLANSHQALREAVERARGALGMVRAELSGPGTTTAHLMILVRAASRIAAAGVTLAEIRGRDLRHRQAHHVGGTFDTSTQELESACRAVAASVLSSGRRKCSLMRMRARLVELTSTFGGTHRCSHLNSMKR